jgi:type IV pilus biogenesis protein CpaD/CtpE
MNNKYLIFGSLLILLVSCSSPTQSTAKPEQFETNEPIRAAARRIDASLDKGNQEHCTSEAKAEKTETFAQYERAYKNCMEPILRTAELDRNYKSNSN